MIEDNVDHISRYSLEDKVKELLNKFSSIKLYFDTFFNNDFSITSLNGFLSMAIPNLKLLAKSVINFDI
jgi:hypothetical protein